MRLKLRFGTVTLAVQLSLWEPTVPVVSKASVLVDFGAGETFITEAMYQQLGSPPFQGTHTVVDALKNETVADGIGPLYGDVKKQLGEGVV